MLSDYLKKNRKIMNDVIEQFKTIWSSNYNFKFNHSGTFRSIVFKWLKLGSLKKQREREENDF